MALMKHARVKGKLHNGAVKDRRLYNRWYLMRRRCYDRDFVSFPEYGARGITVCAAWLTSYAAFQSWALTHGWKPGLTIDRIDSHGPYSPENCRWATPKEQSENRAAFRITATLHGVTKNVSAWADELGMPRKTVYMRIRVLRWSPERALTTPVKPTRPKVTVDGETMSIYAWAAKLDVERGWLYQQINHYNKSPEQVIKRLKEKRK